MLYIDANLFGKIYILVAEYQRIFFLFIIFINVALLACKTMYIKWGLFTGSFFFVFFVFVKMRAMWEKEKGDQMKVDAIDQ